MKSVKKRLLRFADEDSFDSDNDKPHAVRKNVLFIAPTKPLPPGNDWKLIVDAHILRHSLAISFIAGVGVAILLIVAEYAIGAVVGTQAAAS